MNNLSWFIYFTQVVDNLRDAAFAMVLFGAFALGGCLLFQKMMEDIERKDAGMMPWIKRGAILWVVAGLCLVVTPTKQTMLLIAGSEIGERAINSETVKEVVNPGMDLVKSWIRAESEKLAKR